MFLSTANRFKSQMRANYFGSIHRDPLGKYTHGTKALKQKWGRMPPGCAGFLVALKKLVLAFSGRKCWETADGFGSN